MPKHESTAINDLIHVSQGRVVERGGPEPADGLFVTAPVPPASFVPVAAHFPHSPARAPQQRMAPIASPPPPLPRRRAPSATPSVMPVPAVRPIFEDDDDDAETQFDPAVAARFAAGSAPAHLPPAPAAVLPQAAVSGLPMTRPQITRSSFEDPLETVRVRALPPPPLAPEARGEIVALLRKLVLPFSGLAILLMFVGGYLVHNGEGGHHREPPVVMAVTPPPAPAPAPVVAAAAAPVELPSVAAPAAAVASAWKPTVVQPTIAPIEEQPAVEPALRVAPAMEAEEIEMDATTVAKARHHRRTSPAVAMAPARVPVAKPVAKPARRADPVAVALAEPTKSAKSAVKGTGPGKVTITSTPAALIYVDGRSTNQMTPKTLPLAAGTHKITLLEVSTRKAKTQEIEVEAGGTLQIAKKF